MASVLADLKPSLLWKHFDEICKIPHESKNETALGDYVLQVAEKNGVEAKRDGAGNVVVKVPGTPGHENSPIIVLQGHLDMVCEKNSDVEHDFDKDPIKVMIDGEWVTADGTTLGADNGIGLAAALAVLEDDSVEHGPLELLCTTDEETGLNGARELSPDFLDGRILLNLDSEEEGAFTISCAGGADSDVTLPLKRESAGGGTGLKIALKGLRGGHSGIDIHTGRGNATQLLARILLDVNVDFKCVSLVGGSKHNAIPREAWAEVIVQNDKLDDFKSKLTALGNDLAFEYKAVETDLKLEIENGDVKMDPMDDATGKAFLEWLVALPHGVVAMSQEIPGLVETSNNLAILTCEADSATMLTSTRSSIKSALEATRSKIEAVGNLAGAKATHHEGYPPWTPNLKSPLLETMKKVYKDQTGEDVEVMAIHAGLECGIIGEKYDGMDMISFGPDLRNPHSPDEKVHIASVGRFWDLLVATLKALL